MADKIQMRRDTAANWSSANPILFEGELGFETDTNRYKLGDGTTAWNSLDYRNDKLQTQTVNVLPTPSEATMGKLYLVSSGNTGETNNTYDEYITVKQKVGWWLEDVIGELFEKAIPNPTGDNIAYGTTDDISLDLIEQAAIEVGALVLNKEESIEWDGELESAAWDRAIAFYDENPGGVGFMRAEVGTVYESGSDGLNYILTSQGWVDVDSIPDSGENFPILRDAYSYSWEKIGGTMNVDNVPTLGSDNLVKSGGVYSAIENAKNAVKNAIQVTTAELRNLKSSQSLIGGTWYEITDYDKPTISDATAIITIGGQSLHPTIISDPNTAAYHNLGLCVLALGVETLSNEGFAVCENLNYPRLLKVRVDISSSSNKRPSWADSSKPWVYWMQDDNGNEAPFDFINIGFKGTLDSTINTEGGITNGILPQTSNGWYAFNSTTINMGSDVIAINGAIGGACKNCKITGYNIIFGKADGITIEGSGSIVRNTDNSNSLKNVIVRGDNNKLYTVHYADGSNSVIQGYSNIIANSTVTMGKNNTQNIIKGSNKVVFGENNSYFEIDDASAVTIGNNNQYWDIKASDKITIGDNNVGSSSTHCLIGTTSSREDGDISENVTIGNNNTDIRIKNARHVTIGNNNNTITCLYPNDGDGIEYTTIGNKNNTIEVPTDYLFCSTIGDNNEYFYLFGSYIKIGSWNRYLNISDTNKLTIGDNNQFGDANYKSGGVFGSIQGGDITIGSNNRWIHAYECNNVVIGNNNGSGDRIAANISAGIYLNNVRETYIGDGNAKTPASTERGGILIDSCADVTVGHNNELISISDECDHITIADDNRRIDVIGFMQQITIGSRNNLIGIIKADDEDDIYGVGLTRVKIGDGCAGFNIIGERNTSSGPSSVVVCSIIDDYTIKNTGRYLSLGSSQIDIPRHYTFDNEVGTWMWYNPARAAYGVADGYIAGELNGTTYGIHGINADF